MSSTVAEDDIKAQQSNKIGYQDIAAKLLKDKLLLTALELHTELVEGGKEIRILKDYFSNPGNFELSSQAPAISRSGSQVTLDSLDLTRLSEDGEKNSDERVAVLEFELRKARETISALRNNLTVATECEPVSQLVNQEKIKPHEQRALNFLINEYLLTYGYKLTSITFADENESQDFEDWDDVGLNISKPAELLHLYREGLKQTGQNCLCAETQTDEKIEEVEALLSENRKLNALILELNSKLCDVQNSNLLLNEQLATKKSDLALEVSNITKRLSSNSSKVSNSDSTSPEHFEMIDRSSTPLKKRTSIEIIDDNIFNDNEWMNLTINSNELNDEMDKTSIKTDISNVVKTTRQLPVNFKKELLNLCNTNVDDVINQDIFEKITAQTLVHAVSSSLLRIIPNIILNKREEAIPLLITAIQLNTNSSERDKLLEQLFNLKKKPSQEERSLILLGILKIAKYSGEDLVENEILPQCWEQLTNKYVERRLLVVESCIALIPYVSSPIRNSLILSMLQQMLEDKDEAVRIMVVRALALVVGLCDDVDKYVQLEEVVVHTLSDTSDEVVNVSLQVLFPVIAQWAFIINRLQTDLIKKLLYKLNKHLKEKQSEYENYETPMRIIDTLDLLLPFIFLSIADGDRIMNKIDKNMAIELRSDVVKLCTPLTNPSNFYSGNVNVGMVFYEFNNFFKENFKETWAELDWFLDIVLPDLINNLNHIEVTQHLLLEKIIQLQHHICIIFGNHFTQTKIFPLFQSHIQNLEQILSSFNQYSPSLTIIPIYLVSVLSHCDDLNELSSALKRFICALPLCGIPLDCLEVSIRGLCQLGRQELVVSCLWEGVMHQRPLVRSATAGLFSSIIGLCNDQLLTAKITPALVTLVNDTDVLVRTATIPALGNLITDSTLQEVHDKAYMQIQSCLTDPGCKENHALLRQLVITLGNIVDSCKVSFRDEVILTQLSSLSAYTYQMSNHTRKIDMALALIETFSKVIYSPLSTGIIGSVLLPGLRHLEVIIEENPTLLPHQNSVSSMIKEYENRVQSLTAQSPVDRATSSLSQNVNQGVEDMKQRVSKIFQKSSTPNKQNALPNFQSIFKKK